MNIAILRTPDFDHLQGWSEDEIRSMPNIRSLTDLANFAIAIMRRRGNNLSLISGPISTGPGNSTEERVRIFAHGIAVLARDKRLNVFSQIPFEVSIGKYAKLLQKRKWREPDEYCWPILHLFYARVFGSGLVRKLHFMPNWHRSVGASWEFEVAENYGIDRIILPDNFTDRVVAELQAQPELALAT